MKQTQKRPCRGKLHGRFSYIYQIKLFLDTGLALFDELLGHAGAAAAGPDGESLGLDQELVVGHLNVVLLGQLGEDGLKACFLRPLERDRQAEPGGKAHELLPGVRRCGRSGSP